VTTRRKVILSIIGVIAFLYLGVYTVLTPFIRGVVVDDTTKQPVENAWVMATASIGTRTIAGDVGGARAISHRHLRTGKDGVFYIFPKLYLSFPTPYTFGNMKKSLNLTVRVMDGKRAEVNLTKSWWRRFILLPVAVRYERRSETQLHAELSNLSGYCIYGVREKTKIKVCDNWELEYTIKQNEAFLKMITEPIDVHQRVYYSATLYDLGKLYKRKGELAKALDLFKAVREFDLKRGIKWNINDYNKHINELENQLRND